MLRRIIEERTAAHRTRRRGQGTGAIDPALDTRSIVYLATPWPSGPAVRCHRSRPAGSRSWETLIARLVDAVAEDAVDAHDT